MLLSNYLQFLKPQGNDINKNYKKFGDFGIKITRKSWDFLVFELRMFFTSYL